MAYGAHNEELQETYVSLAELLTILEAASLDVSDNPVVRHAWIHAQLREVQVDFGHLAARADRPGFSTNN